MGMKFKDYGGGEVNKVQLRGVRHREVQCNAFFAASTVQRLAKRRVLYEWTAVTFCFVLISLSKRDFPSKRRFWIGSKSWNKKIKRWSLTTLSLTVWYLSVGSSWWATLSESGKIFYFLVYNFQSFRFCFPGANCRPLLVQQESLSLTTKSWKSHMKEA